MNSVNIIGRLGQDPELKYTESGTAVTNLSVAVDGRGENETHWITVVVWDQQAENVVQYLGAGERVGISGRLQQRSWTTQDGENRSKLEVVAYHVDFLGGGQRQEQSQQQPTGEVAGDTSADPFAGV
jgi:single-strand DNA-binding protein